MRAIVIVLITFFISLIFQRCDYLEILYKEDEIITVDEWIDEFEEIQVDIPIELILEQSSDQIAEITGFEFKVNNLKLTVENKTLIIDEKDFMLNRKDQLITVKLTVQNLKRITLNEPTILSTSGELALEKFTMIVNGPGTYSETNLLLDCQSITLAAFGKNSGQHILEGKTENLQITMEGLAWTNASQMIATNATVYQRSHKNTYVNVTGKLIVNMYSVGNVYFKGNPQIEYNIIVPDWDVGEFGKVISQPE